LAKGLALATDKPLIGINHIEAHLYSAWLTPDETEETPEPEFPLLALVVSGGHTELILMNDHLTYTRLGGTLDDAAGEAFDKISRLLELGYPGGPAIEAAAIDGDPEMIKFPRAWLEGTWDFSFSGLKTSVLRVVRRLEESQREIPVNDVAASFQNAVVDVLVGKTLEAAAEHGAQSILIAGGVSANLALRATIQNQSEIPVYIPKLEYCTDNAAMVAAAGYQRNLIGQRDDLDIDALPTWPISELSSPG
jgi:N6-L-threonylcarbamoyladenine synthase